MITEWRGYHAVLYLQDHGPIKADRWQWLNPTRAKQLVDAGVCEYYDAEKVAKRRAEQAPKSPVINTQRVEPKYTPIPVDDLTIDDLWRKIFVSMKKAGYPVRESMTKAQLLELRDAKE